MELYTGLLRMFSFDHGVAVVTAVAMMPLEAVSFLIGVPSSQFFLGLVSAVDISAQSIGVLLNKI